MFKRLFLTILVLTLVVLVSYSTVEKQQRTVMINDIPADNDIKIQQISSVMVLRVATLNLVHGRKDSFNQMFEGEETHKQNLNAIANVLK